MRDKMIKWPAIIKYHGDNELSYISSGAEWETDQGLSTACYDADDRLIDSDGVVFSIASRAGSITVPTAIEERLELGDMEDLVRVHFSSVGECCVSKFSISSIAEGITTVGQFEES
ncbi:DUF4144 family protein [Neptuniibacter sp. QD29_5]|uniref:DUF4144 family protein n=1 Tax=Neptuniibacter sp. QD29_5 TaxID=3398207 RepID=UPI0039F5D3C1